MTPPHDAKQLLERVQRRLENEASRRNSAYDVFGMDNTPQSVDPDVFALIERVRVLEEALHGLFIQALQSNVNDPANEYGWEAIQAAKAALTNEKESQL